MSDILFILKKRNNYQEWPESYTEQGGYFSSGLYNSVKFLVDVLKKVNIDAELVEVIDNNGIDRAVTLNKPKVVIVEALWVVPEKFEVLSRLHPDVKWIVRIHSEIPFLANEGNAMAWISAYLFKKNVYVSANSLTAKSSLETAFGIDVLYLPNYYPLSDNKRKKINKNSNLNISCFGAIRPMKNHLQQAVAAIKFANSIGKDLSFHVNAVRVEQKGDSVLRNLEALFENSQHELVKCPWMPHDEFKSYIEYFIDLGMQVSFSETFNIVTADHIDMGVPVVTSKEVEFVFNSYQADPTSEYDIFKKLGNAYNSKFHNMLNKYLLSRSNEEAIFEWTSIIRQMRFA